MIGGLKRFIKVGSGIGFEDVAEVLNGGVIVGI